MLILNNISKIYQIGDREPFFALKDFSYNFPNKGLVAIIGKSGSGKSTLANIIARLDIPSRGTIVSNNKNITSLKGRDLDEYRLNEIGLVFQNYNLILEDSVLANAIYPLNLKNHNKDDGVNKAKLILNSLGIDKSLFDKKVKDISGGEAQRVAIARAIINDPKIIIADEPTGALDYRNSIKIMGILSVLAKEKLVILISHNKKIVKKYADEIIELRDGKINKIEKKKALDRKIIKETFKKTKRDNKWIFLKTLNNIKKHKSKNVIVFTSMIFSLVFLFLIFGFSNGSKDVIDNVPYRIFDYGSATISKVETISQNASRLKLKKTRRLFNEELALIKDEHLLNYVTEYNLDAFIDNPKINYSSTELNNLVFRPIINFEDSYYNSDILIKGSVPKDLNGVIINQNAESYLKDNLQIDNVIGLPIHLNKEKEFSFYLFDGSKEETIFDTYVLDKTFVIYGVCEEFSFLNYPKVYYSYDTLISYCKDSLMNNVSEKLGNNYSWYDYVANASNDSEVSCYSHRIFLDCHSDIDCHHETIRRISQLDYIDFSSDGYVIKTTFCDLINASTMGVGAFVAISLLGTILILGLSSFSSFAFERKNNAIYSALGARRKDIFKIYILENVFLSIGAFVLATSLSWPISLLVNLFLKSFVGIENMINLSLFSFLNIPFLLVGIVLISIFAISAISTIVPLGLSRRISLKEELKAND